MAYNIAICDDNGADSGFVSALVSQWAEGFGAAVNINIFSSAEAFLFNYSENKDYDLLLLDIEMSGMDGVTMAKEVRRDNAAVQIVFITGYSDYILDGYDVAALHYLIKPVSREKLFSVLDRAAEKLKINERTLDLELSGGMVRVPFLEIRYLEVRQNYCTVHAKEDYTVKRTLGDIEKELDDRFFRTGRSFIVSLPHVRRVSKTEVILDDGTSVPLSRGLYDKINRAIISRD